MPSYSPSIFPFHTVDLTMNAALDFKDDQIPSVAIIPPTESNATNIADEERGCGGLSSQIPALSTRRRSGRSSPEGSDETEPRTRMSSSESSTGALIKKKTSQLLGIGTSSSSQKGAGTPITPKLAALVQAYVESDVAAGIRSETAEIASAQRTGEGGDELPDVVVESYLLKGRKRASWGTQFRILSGRAFKNLYRDPALLAAHYISSIALACEWSRLCLVSTYSSLAFS
jgi:hypothetical protein